MLPRHNILESLTCIITLSYKITENSFGQKPKNLIVPQPCLILNRQSVNISEYPLASACGFKRQTSEKSAYRFCRRYDFQGQHGKSELSDRQSKKVVAKYPQCYHETPGGYYAMFGPLRADYGGKGETSLCLRGIANEGTAQAWNAAKRQGRDDRCSEKNEAG